MAAFNFGVGSLWAARTDVSNPTPAQFGTLQDISVDFDFTSKPLMGQYQIPVAVARGGMKVNLKAKSATINSGIFNQSFFGQTQTLGGVTTILNEADSVPATSTYTITVAQAATYKVDLGVVYAATGLRFTRVASVSASGQYSVNTTTGVYTFNSTDASAAVLISYSYTTSTGSQLITITNQLMGAAPQFQVNLTNTYQAKLLALQLNACISTKLSLPFKNEDWTISEIDIEAFTDASNTLGTLTVTDL
jgi:hypothetical protein